MSGITNDTQALVMGVLLATMTMEGAKYRAQQGDALLKITDVRPHTDEDNNYLNTFAVTFESGTTLVVSVNEVTEIQEQS